MKYLRLYIIFGFTLLGLIYILFIFKPKYLYKYKDQFTIKYEIPDKGDYSWSYEIDNDVLKVSNEENLKWTFKPTKDGKSTITFYYKKPDDTEDKYKYKIVYDFEIKGNKIFWLTGMGYGIVNFPNPY